MPPLNTDTAYIFWNCQFYFMTLTLGCMTDHATDPARVWALSLGPGQHQICFQWNTIAVLVNLIHDADASTRLRSY